MSENKTIILFILTFLNLFTVYPVTPEFIPTLMTFAGLGLSVFLMVTTIKGKSYKAAILATVLVTVYLCIPVFGFKTFTLAEFIHIDLGKSFILMNAKEYLITWMPDETEDMVITTENNSIAIEGGSDVDFLRNLQNIEACNYWRPFKSANQQLSTLKISEESFMFSLSPIAEGIGSLRYYKHSGYGNNKEYEGKLLLSEDLFSCLPEEIKAVISTHNIPESSDDTTILEEDFLVEQAMYLASTEVMLDSPPSEKQKGDFFLWIIANDDFYNKEFTDQWKVSNDKYEIPLTDIQEVLFQYLDTDVLDPQEAFKDNYDRKEEVLFLDMIGGYGGARDLELLDYTEKDGTVHITIGNYSFGQQESVLLGEYEIVIEIQDSGKLMFVSNRY